ncbi:uncharacterized protein LOC132188327 [Corylus avellana]|uniref:uncharacterized protein LOC132188327 n=1 Tax=Corylus avellana TaxID=13451 RepID=UPI00286CAA22|nr:uncharacterized protein LOC132188327 [Corylus avellana]
MSNIDNMAGTKVSLKLVVDKKKQQLLFAEAEKKFVDFLFTIFSLPVGTVTRLLREEGMVGCLPSLYKSIENLSDDCFQLDRNKDFLLKPRVVIPGLKAPLLLPNDELFTCRKNSETMCRNRGCSAYRIREISYKQGESSCSSCSDFMNKISKEGGYVKGMVSYMVMDDLEVKPMSTNSGITLLREFNVKAAGDVEEKVVYLGMDEGLKLLKASLQSKTVLTDVFLPIHRAH